MGNLKDKQGFTFIEILVATFLTVVVITLSIYLLHDASRIYTNQRQKMGAYQKARLALEFMSREINNAGYDPLLITSAGIPTGNETFIQIVADLNSNGVIDINSSEDVTYQFDITGIDSLGQIMRMIDINDDGDFDDANESIVLAGDILPGADCDLDNINEGIFCYNNSPPSTTTVTVSFISRAEKSDIKDGKYLEFPLGTIISPKNLKINY